MIIEVGWDPFDESLKADPHPIWKRLRDEEPLYRNERHDFWALSRFDDVDAALRDPVTFSSAYGTVLELMTEHVQTGPLMIFLDPPEHTRLRRLVSRAFTPRGVAELEGDVRNLCRALLGDRGDRHGLDVVADYGAVVPAEVIATLLGVPPEDRAEVRRHIDGSFHLEPDVGMANPTAAASWTWLSEYITDQLRSRRARRRDDMLSDLLEAQLVDGDGSVHRLGVDDASVLALLLISAGTETVARLIGWAAFLLARHPDQRAALVADPSMVPGAVEEVLRFESPSPVQARRTTAPVVYYGTTVPAGSKVLLLNGAANRDERRFPDADQFDVCRGTDLHLAFGYGVHFCLGAALARLEGRVAVEELLARYPEYDVDPEGAVLLSTSTVRGYERLPLLV